MNENKKPVLKTANRQAPAGRRRAKEGTSGRENTRNIYYGFYRFFDGALWSKADREGINYPGFLNHAIERQELF